MSKKLRSEIDLESTGERMMTTMKGEIISHHLHRYALAMKLSQNKIVLDIASGEGYGTNLIAKVAKHVTGVDISENAIGFAKNKYQKENLVFKQGSTSKIPLNNESIDLIVSFETIEHHNEHEQMIYEFKRVLKPDGLILISSPDKKYYSDIPKYNNPFHVKELYFKEFQVLIQKHFNFSKFYNQNVVFGSIITPADTKSEGFIEFSGDFNTITEKSTFDPVYNICIASNHSLPEHFHDELSIFNSTFFINELAEVPNQILNSKTYKAGLIITSPFRLIRKLFGK